MSKFLILILSILIFFSCGIDTNLTSFNTLSQKNLNNLRNGIETRNVTLGRLINFDQFWETYPGAEYTNDEAKTLIGGRVDADWITNTCAIRLSRGLNYSDNVIDKENYREIGGEVISGADGKWYGFRVSEMSEYLLRNYGTPLNIQKENITVDPENRYSELNATESERLEQKVKDLGVRGIIMFKVNVWSDATGHLEPWNGYRSKDHSRFREAQEIFIWKMDELPKCGGVVCEEDEACLQDSCEVKCGNGVCNDEERCINNQCVINGCYITQDCNGISEICINNLCVEDNPNRCGNSICNADTEKCINSICVQKNGNGDTNGDGTGNNSGTGNPSCNYSGTNAPIFILIFFIFTLFIRRNRKV